MIIYLKFNTSLLTLILSLFFSYCIGQTKESFPVRITKTHQDSMSTNALFLPEFRNSVHDKDYQGNQISGVIRTVFQDSKGSFWFGTQDGLCRNDKNGLIYFRLKDSYNQNVTVYAILEDKAGNIWIGYGGGIAKYDGSYFTMYREKEILTSSSLWSMTMDRNGLLWIGTTSGVYTFDGEALSPFEIPEGKKNPANGISTAKMIHSIIEDKKGRIWFATNGGVYFHDGKTLTNLSEKDGLPTNFVNQVKESKDGNFWISTTKGLFKYNGNTLKNITEKLLNQDDAFGCFLEDKNGILWFSVNKRDIYRYGGKEFTKIESKVGDFEQLPFQIYQDQQERLWFVGLKGAYRYENNSFINVNRNGPW
jgi:ligand-binding sensor domain-containing protein